MSLKIIARADYKIPVIAILLAGCVFLTYYFHGVLKICTMYPHFFYIPIILSTLWWKKKGVVVALFLAVLLTASHIFFRREITAYEDYLRALMFITIALVISALSDRIAKTERQLIDSETLYRIILNNISDAIFITDDQGDFTFIHPSVAAVFGYSFDEVHSMGNISKLIRTETTEHYNARLAAGEEIKNIELEATDKDGASLSLLLNIKKISLKGGTLLYTCRDITDRKKTEKQVEIQREQLIQSSKMASLGILVAGIAHEINNPNNFISFNAEILKESWKDILPVTDNHYENNRQFLLAGLPYSEMRKEIDNSISAILKGSKRIDKIISGLKDFSSQDKGNLNQTVNINSVIESAALIVNNIIRGSTDYFRIHYDHSLPLIKGNSQQLEQVIINLITNACQALTSKTQALTVSTAYLPPSNSITIQVTDEGKGIAACDLPYITEPFFTTRRDSNGTGLGLSISYSIIKNHNGTLEFNSKLEEGTTAVITLPVNAVSSYGGKKDVPARSG